jgi:hypothetical protein
MTLASDTAKTSEVLRNDVLECVVELVNSDTPKNRRTLVRAIFAEVESSIYLFRRLALNPQEPEAELDASEKAFLKEEQHEISEHGEIRVKQYFGRFLANFRFVIRMYMKVNGLNKAIDYSGSGWNALQKATKIRNRLTHPREATDLEVTDDEIEIIGLAYNYQHDIFQELLVQNLNRLKRKVSEANAELHQAKEDLQKSEDYLAEMKRVSELGLEKMRKTKAEFDAIAWKIRTGNLSESEMEIQKKRLDERLAELHRQSDDLESRLSGLIHP